jgi:hypothetical protein
MVFSWCLNRQPRKIGAPAGDAVAPPSTKISAPWMFEASTEAKNSALLATSSTLPNRLSGMACELRLLSH